MVYTGHLSASSFSLCIFLLFFFCSLCFFFFIFFFFSSRRRHTRLQGDWSSDVCSSDLSSSSVGSRPSSSLICSATRRIFEILSTRCTGKRIVLLWFASARLMDCLKIGRASCRERV